MTLIEAIVLFVTTSCGAVLGVVLQRYFSRARPSVFVKSCELSSVLLSRVDYVSMPERIAERFSHFKWKLIDDKEKVASNSSILPIGVAQEQQYCLQEFLPRLEDTLAHIDSQRQEFVNGGQEERRAAVSSILHDQILLQGMMGMTRRASYSLFSDKSAMDKLDYDPEKTLLPWAHDDASGVGKGTYGAYTLHVRDARINFPFEWRDEQERMKAVSYAFASCNPDVLPRLLKEIADELRNDKLEATELSKWFSANLDSWSTFTLSMSISNLGRQPILVSDTATLTIVLPGRERVQLNCFCESYSDDTNEDSAASRTVEIMARISQLLDIAIPIRRKVLTEKTLVDGGDAATLTFRSDQALKDVPDGDSLLNLYRSRKLRGFMEVSYQATNGRMKSVESSEFSFASCIPESRNG